MSLYDEMQELTKSLLSDPDFKQGTSALVKVTPGGGMAYKPGAPTETSIIIDAVARGVSFKYLQRNLAVASDIQVTFAPVFLRADETGGVVTFERVRRVTQADRDEWARFAGWTFAGTWIDSAPLQEGRWPEILAVEPSMNDFIVLDGVPFKIVHIDRKPSIGTAVAFTVIVRR